MEWGQIAEGLELLQENCQNAVDSYYIVCSENDETFVLRGSPWISLKNKRHSKWKIIYDIVIASYGNRWDLHLQKKQCCQITVWRTSNLSNIVYQLYLKRERKKRYRQKTSLP